MEEIILTKENGFVATKWNGETRSYDRIEVRNHHMALREWRTTVKLEEGATLGSLCTAMTLLDDCAPFSYLCNGDIPAMLREAAKAPDHKQNMEYLELHLSAEVDGDGYFFFYDNFHGIGPNSDGETTSWAIELTPINQMVHIPLVLNEKFEVVTGDDWPQKVILSAKKGFDLGDLIRGVFWELSFFGSPEDRNAMSEELHRRADEVQQGLVETKSIDDIIAKLKNPPNDD